jgi:hypothetical protein
MSNFANYLEDCFDKIHAETVIFSLSQNEDVSAVDL